nr:hypothetical protein [Bacillus subtilis]
MKLALTAPLRAGKSETAGYLSLHYDFHPFAFGDELKAAFHRAFPSVPEKPKPRAYYQKVRPVGARSFRRGRLD